MRPILELEKLERQNWRIANDLKPS